MTSYTYRRTLAPFVDDVSHRNGSPYGGATGNAYRVLCSDGRVRTAIATGEADTMYTLPARVTVNGRTVTGSVYHRGNLDYRRAGWPEFDDSTPLYRFTADVDGRNAGELPAWPAHVRIDGTRKDGAA